MTLSSGTYEVIIVGGGFAGIGMAIKLLEANIDDFVVLERATEVGGTWRENTYPGCACDVPAHLYSYSFEPNPDWSRMFAPQREIKAYLEKCIDKYGVRRKIRFESEMRDATFDEHAGMWTLLLADGTRLRTRSVVLASGLGLSRPVFPDIPGRERFRGKSMHSAKWDHDYPLEGKSVAVIGTGASAIQIVPSIAPRVGKMHVFQRTAPWIQPRPDRAFSPGTRAFFRKHPAAQAAFRGAIYSFLESMAFGYVVDQRATVLRERTCTRFRERMITDPALRKKLTPNYRLGCKRVLVSSDYYPALTRENVELVTDRIAAIEEDAVVTGDGARRKVDAIVFATGFETSEMTLPFSIRGRGDRTLSEVWKGGMEAYAGTTISGFPNLFMMVGPNTALGHNSMIHVMESQFPYILDAIQTVRAKNLKMVDVRADIQKTYNENIQRRLAGTVWSTGGCKSWYLTKTGKNTTLWPGFTFQYRWMMRRFDLASYDIVHNSIGSRVVEPIVTTRAADAIATP